MASTQLICLDDYEKKAVELLDSRYRDFYATGADDEQTLEDNRNDFKRLRLRPKMMVDVSQVSFTTTILGEKINFPVCIAPTSQHKLAHPSGEMATARAVREMGTCFCLSTAANTSAAEISKVLPDSLKWFQLNIHKDPTLTRALIKRAEEAHFKALVITVDHPVVGNRRRRMRNDFELPPHVSLKNFSKLLPEGAKEPEKDTTLTWTDLTQIISTTSLPVIVKGILTGEDAGEAIKAGCSAVYVSNHGGRQLDGVYSGIAALPEVVKVVNGRVEVYMDGGIRTGTDVLKALALGARAVFKGRPAIYGLAVGGEEGVRGVLTILRDELKLAMQLSGITDVERIPRNLVVHESAIPRL